MLLPLSAQERGKIWGLGGYTSWSKMEEFLRVDTGVSSSFTCSPEPGLQPQRAWVQSPTLCMILENVWNSLPRFPHLYSEDDKQYLRLDLELNMGFHIKALSWFMAAHGMCSKKKLVIINICQVRKKSTTEMTIEIVGGWEDFQERRLEANGGRGEGLLLTIHTKDLAGHRGWEDESFPTVH